jgi:hypothetical protein
MSDVKVVPRADDVAAIDELEIGECRLGRLDLRFELN